MYVLVTTRKRHFAIVDTICRNVTQCRCPKNISDHDHDRSEQTKGERHVQRVELNNDA
jgi:hypothetical protein